jgi:hypothetical protein
MRSFLSLLFLVTINSAFSQDISGEWVSGNVKAYQLSNETASRVYHININSKNKSLLGESRIYFKSKDGFLKTGLFGNVDTLNHVIVLHTENFRSSIDATEQHMKDYNNYKWTYSSDGSNEYLTLVRNEEFPHIMLDSNISFSRVKKVAVKSALIIKETVKPKEEPITHPVTERANKVFKEILADVDSIKVDLYDVGEIDGDSVSLFLNDQLVASHQMLKASAMTFMLKLDRNIPENKLVLFAENLGKVPPNSAYMVITVGKKEYSVNMQSDEKTNGEIVFRFLK